MTRLVLRQTLPLLAKAKPKEGGGGGAGGGGKKGKAGADGAASLLPTGWDALNARKSGSPPPQRAAADYPDWLWKLLDEPVPTRADLQARFDEVRTRHERRARATAAAGALVDDDESVGGDGDVASLLSATAGRDGAAPSSGEGAERVSGVDMAARELGARGVRRLLKLTNRERVKAANAHGDEM